LVVVGCGQAGNNEAENKQATILRGFIMPIASDIHANALALFRSLPEPHLAPASTRLYLTTLKRMMAEDIVEPLRAGDARDTYNVRRAALHAGTWILLRRHLDAFLAASKTGDRTAARQALAVLERIVARCGPAIQRDPPMDRDQSSFASPPSRWTEAEGPKPRRGKASKKHMLKVLPADWTDRIWRAAAEADNWKYLDALAVHMLSPARPAEFVPAEREGQFVAGIEVWLDGDILAIGVAPVKSHDGKYGTGDTEIRLDARSHLPAVAHLVALCRDNGGKTVISLTGANAMRKALAKLGHKVLGEVVVVTGYLFRHQYLADLKATVGAGATVAAAAGHCTDRTQSRYGRVEHGRRRDEFISVVASRIPKGGNVARASSLRRASIPHGPGSAMR
jgi:hypothetical protein